MLVYVIAAILALTLASYFIGWRRSLQTVAGQAGNLHSRPGYYGAFVAAWVGIPALILVLLWLMFQSTVIDTLLLASLPDEKTANLTDAQVDLVISEIKQVSRGNTFGQPDQAILDAAQRYQTWQGIASWSMLAAAISFCILGLLITRSRISPEFRARQRVESVMNAFMISCSVIAILTTVGIVVSLLIEALRFLGWYRRSNSSSA